MCAMVNITLLLLGVDEVDELFSWKDLANAKTGSSSMIPRKSSSTAF